MICKAICAFREPFDDGFVEAIYPGAMVDVPAPLVNRLVDCGHIERPGIAAAVAEETETAADAGGASQEQETASEPAAGVKPARGRKGS